MTLRLLRLSLVVAAALVPLGVNAQSEDAVWLDLLRSTGHARGVRGAFIYQCREHLASAPRHMAAICAKLLRIPDQVIEQALLPHAKRHLSAELAKAAIEVWRTPESQFLVGKVARDVESGGREPLSPEDVRALRQRSDTEFGQALLAFGKDQDALRAAVRAMAAYEP
jgi:hypothetical protein